MYKGLSDAEVAESRRLHGENVLTPPEKESAWMRWRRVLGHWIALGMTALWVISLIMAAALGSSVTGNVWVMPAAMLLASLLVALVGYFGGFKDPLFRILIMAFVMSMGISVYEYEWAGEGLTTFFEPIGIIVALLLANGVAYVLERNNEKTFQSLNQVNDDTPVKVIRNGQVGQVPRRGIVVGDVIILEEGEEVPADAELLDALHLTVNESTLTGEPQAVKSADPSQFDPEATYPTNHLLKGTTVMEGYCQACVLRVGNATESGKVFQAAQVDDGGTTPLNEKLNRLARWITVASYLIAALVVVGRLVSYLLMQSRIDWFELLVYLLHTVMIAVTLIVVAVPEGLPMSVTLSLAFSMRRLMKENTLPRTIHSCETMGAATVICTDKTGTLTQNQMQVADVTAEPLPDGLLAEMIAANTTANLDLTDLRPQVIGNPTEGALLLWLHQQDIDYRTMRQQAAVIDRLPFSTIHKYMATAVKSGTDGRTMVYVKGAPEIILRMCRLDDDTRRRYEDRLAGWQQKAMRTLAVAYAECQQPLTTPVQWDRLLNGSESPLELRLAGIFAILDPVRTEVPAAITQCMEAGIGVKVVTGDTVGTAREIGRQIGLWTDADGDSQMMTGTEFAAMTDEQLVQRVQDLKILSRARPADKERLVRLLKSRGYVVAVTGDGTNDAPALNAADVGLSMGDGTAVAKEASDMTILDNSFSTIVNAVVWGRSLYKNIQRFILFQSTINVVACLVVLVGAFTGTRSPLTVTQMLWVNLIMDTFAAIALASLPPTVDVMREKPRRMTDSIVSRPMAVSIFGVGLLFTAVLLWLLSVMHSHDITGMSTLWSAPYTPDGQLSDYELSLFFTIFVMLQFWNMFNAKAFMTGSSAFFRIRQSRGFIAIAALIVVGQVLIVELGGQMFNVTHLSLSDWLWIIALTSPVMWIPEIKRQINLFFRTFICKFAGKKQK